MNEDIKEKLWAGVELKLENARFHFEKTGQSLEPPENTQMNVALQSAGAIIDKGWQRSFYAHLDAFLSTARSVADIINCCFGHDTAPPMKNWFNNLTPDEQGRRKKFSGDFKDMDDYKSFINLPLSAARNISVHRTGYPDVTVTINGLFGVPHTGGPISRVPVSETSKIDDPKLAFLAKPRLVQPMGTDFRIDGQDLFEGCSAYLKAAQDLTNVARGIAEQVHLLPTGLSRVLTLNAPPRRICSAYRSSQSGREPSPRRRR